MSDPLTQTQETIPASWRGVLTPQLHPRKRRGCFLFPLGIPTRGASVLTTHHSGLREIPQNPTTQQEPSPQHQQELGVYRAWPSLTPPPVRKGIF